MAVDVTRAAWENVKVSVSVTVVVVGAVTVAQASSSTAAAALRAARGNSGSVEGVAEGDLA